MGHHCPAHYHLRLQSVLRCHSRPGDHVKRTCPSLRVGSTRRTVVDRWSLGHLEIHGSKPDDVLPLVQDSQESLLPGELHWWNAMVRVVLRTWTVCKLRISHDEYEEYQPGAWLSASSMLAKYAVQGFPRATLAFGQGHIASIALHLHAPAVETGIDS